MMTFPTIPKRFAPIGRSHEENLANCAAMISLAIGFFRNFGSDHRFSLIFDFARVRRALNDQGLAIAHAVESSLRPHAAPQSCPEHFLRAQM